MHADPAGPEPTPAFLSGGGELGALIRRHDWHDTPLGPPRQWPQSLRTAVGICLGSSVPIAICWGRELVLLYNDPCTGILGDRHPKALGRPGDECWGEAWPLVGPMLERVLNEGKPITADDLQRMVWRDGCFEERFFCFSCGAIHEDDGSIGGVFCSVVETTDKIVGARRLDTLRALAALRRPGSVEEACTQTIAILSRNDRDIPFAALYLLSEDGRSARLMCATAGMQEPGVELPVEQVAEWPLASALAGPQLLEDLAGRRLPAGHGSEPVRQAYLAPVMLPGGRAPRAMLVMGLSPHQRFDTACRAFAEVLVAQVAATLADALACESERQRAEALAEIDRARTLFFSDTSEAGRERIAAARTLASTATVTRADALVEEAPHSLPDAPAPDAEDAAPGRDERANEREVQMREILIRELQHRTRNLIAVISGIAEQTLAASATLDEFGTRFEERLAAIGRVQGLLAREAQPAVSIGELMRAELLAHGLDPEGDRVRLAGEQVLLPGRTIALLALAAHELMTNAMKHGALRGPGGRIHISWSAAQVADDDRGQGHGQPRLLLTWLESGIRAPADQPLQQEKKRGFGFELLEKLLPFELDASTGIHFADGSLRVQISLPLADDRRAPWPPRSAFGSP